MNRFKSLAASGAARLLALCAAGLLLASPASAQRAEQQTAPGQAVVLGMTGDNLAERTESLVDSAMRIIGANYRWHNDSKGAGFEAGTFVRFIFRDALGFLLPVNVESLGRMGEAVRAVDLKPGDLVFFNTMRRTFSHVGIYLGNNKFIHAPARGSEVRVDDLQNAYWDRRFEGARRVMPVN